MESVVNYFFQVVWESRKTTSAICGVAQYDVKSQELKQKNESKLDKLNKLSDAIQALKEIEESRS